MKESLDKELKNFILLDTIREKILIEKSPTDLPSDFDSYFNAYTSKRNKLFYLSASIAAAILLLLGLSVYKYQQNLKIKEQEHFAIQSELIAITDEAVLTNEYVKYLEDKKNLILEEDILWLTE